MIKLDIALLNSLGIVKERKRSIIIYTTPFPHIFEGGELDSTSGGAFMAAFFRDPSPVGRQPPVMGGFSQMINTWYLLTAR